VSDKHARTKALGWIVSQVQGNAGMTNMPDPRHLDLTVSQIQGNAGLTNMPDPRHLNLTFLKV